MTTVVLVGVPGAGKSTVGAALAARLNVPFVDVDSVVEERAGKTISQIFIDDGESAFRAWESATIADVLQAAGDSVVALGGGALGDAATRERMNGRMVVWLQASLSAAVERVGLNKNRPLLLGNVRGQLADLKARREPVYREAARISVDTSGLTVDEVVDRVISSLAAVS